MSGLANEKDDLLKSGQELFFGTDPDDSADTPQPPQLSRSGTTTQLTFSISADLYEASTPQTLTDGATWKVLQSSDLTQWPEASGSLQFGTAADGKIPVTFTGESTAERQFYRLELTPAP